MTQDPNFPNPQGVPPTNPSTPPQPAPLGYAGPHTGAPGGGLFDPPPPYSGPEPTPDDRTMSMLCFILAIFTGFLGPLIIWLIKKDTSPLVKDQGKEILNWQISVVLSIIPIAALGCIMAFIPYVGILFMIVAWLAYMVLIVGNIVFCVMGAIQANQGKAYRFPFAMRLIK